MGNYCQHGTVKAADLVGREVATLVNEVQNAGFKSVEFSAKGGSASGGDASGLASGVYLHQLRGNDSVLNNKMILMK